MAPANDRKKISVSHVNVRLSISFLVLKLIIADIICTVVMVLIYSLLVRTQLIIDYNGFDPAYMMGTFILVTFIETALTIYIIIHWLSEYYEISPYAVSHRRGVIFKKENRYNIQNIKQIKIEQGVMGRMFNYGTIILFDWRLDKFAELYAVHNPKRYIAILEELLPNVDEDKSTIRESIIESDNDA